MENKKRNSLIKKEDIKRQERKQKIKKILAKIIKIIKIVIFAMTLMLCYLIADKFINWIMTFDINTLKRIVNIILVLISCRFYFKKN